MNMRDRTPVDFMTDEEAEQASRRAADLDYELEALRQAADRLCLTLQASACYEIVMVEQLGKDIREVNRDTQIIRDNIRAVNHTVFPF